MVISQLSTLTEIVLGKVAGSCPQIAEASTRRRANEVVPTIFLRFQVECDETWTTSLADEESQLNQLASIFSLSLSRLGKRL